MIRVSWWWLIREMLPKQFATHCAIFLQQGLLLENMASRTTPPPQRDQRPAGQIVVVLQRRCEVNYNNLTD